VAGRPLLEPEKTLEAGRATYRVSVLQGAGLAALVPLFRESFGRTFFTRGWLERKYACEAGGLAGFSCVALAEDGTPAAACGVLPWAVRFGDRVEVAAQLVDAATARDHRRRGLFTRLAEVAHGVCEAAGVAFLYAFPHVEGDSYPLFVDRLGYEHVDDLVEHAWPIRTVHVDRATGRSAILRPLYERYLERALRPLVPAGQSLANSLVADGFAGIDRDAAFHAYKAAFGGSRIVALPGGRVWLKVSRGLLLGDLEARSDADLERTLAALERLGARVGAHRILFQASRDTRFSFLARRARPERGLAVVYRNLSSSIPAPRLRFTFGDLDNF
jgi:hypothetical protein